MSFFLGEPVVEVNKPNLRDSHSVRGIVQPHVADDDDFF